MKRRILSIVALLLMAAMLLTACGGKTEIERLTITGGLDATVNVGATPDFSKVTATATYSDGTTKTLTAADLTFGTIDTSTAGKKSLTVTCDGLTITVDITVKAASSSGGGGSQEQPGGSEEQTPDYLITGVQKPDTIQQSLDANRGRFTIKTGNYVVGDDNPFTFTLKITALDDNDEQVTLSNYVSVSAVYLVDGSTEALADATYVTVDETKHTYDFTQAAVGKTFKIVVRPRDVYEDDYVEFSQTLLVDVVDGYNVTNAKELNLMTNAPDNMHELYEAQYGTETRQNQVAKSYIDYIYGNGYYDTYGGDALKGLVFHCDLTPTTADIPADYVVTTKGVAAFDESFTVYPREFTNADGGTFNLYGNFFTLNTGYLPLMSDDPALVGTQVSSDSDVFSIDVASAITVNYENPDAAAFDCSKFAASVFNLAMRGMDGTSNDAAQSGHHMRGLNGWDVTFIDMTYENVIMEAYTISAVLSGSNTRANFNNSMFNNAWQNHIFVWAHNQFQSYNNGLYENDAPWASLSPIEIVIRNSSLTKCGGPIIMSISDNNKPYNATAGLAVTVDTASTLSSVVAGTEAWFEAYNLAYQAKDQAQMIKTMSHAISAWAQMNGTSASFTTTEEGVEFMDMIVAALSGTATYTIVDAEGTTVTAALNSAVTTGAASNLAAMRMPVFQSSTGAIAAMNPYATGDDLVTIPGTDIQVPPMYSTSFGAPEASFYTGDTLGMYFQGMSILLGYYN